MASLDDILTTQKNGVVALGSIFQTQRRTAGTTTSATVTSDSLIVSGPGRLVNFVVIVAGSGAGAAYNASTTAAAAPANQLCAFPDEIGIYPCGIEFTNGLVIAPGAGQSINVTYTPGPLDASR